MNQDEIITTLLLHNYSPILATNKTDYSLIYFNFIGNPPYIRQHDNKFFFKKYHNKRGKEFNSIEELIQLL